MWEKLGIKFSDDADFLKRSIDKAGICTCSFISPCHENVGPIRKELAVKTFFNMLSDGQSIIPTESISGSFNLELARIYAYLYQNTDVNVTILHSLDGYDEVFDSNKDYHQFNGRSATSGFWRKSLVTK
jgi:anthranilate phosphoribosyltransferase